jgi:DNA-binding SARP family transcriptional activator
VRFKILGPLQVLVDGRALPLGGPKQRSVLAILLMDANRVVSADRLVEFIWEEAVAGDNARKALQVHVSNLRKALAPVAAASNRREMIITRAPGYQISLDEGELDLLACQATMKRAKAAFIGGDAALASSLYQAALDLWNGSPLADLLTESFAARAALRLDALRFQALENRLKADVASGGHQEVVGELQTLVADNPLNEQFVSLLMIALYRSGRQADALNAYQQCRERLNSEVGLDPGPTLRNLELSILGQDPGLDPPKAITKSSGANDEEEAPNPAWVYDQLLQLDQPDIDGFQAAVDPEPPKESKTPEPERHYDRLLSLSGNPLSDTASKSVEEI